MSMLYRLQYRLPETEIHGVEKVLIRPVAPESLENGGVREAFLQHLVITLQQPLRFHQLRHKDNVIRVVIRPVAVYDSSRLFHLRIKNGARIRSEYREIADIELRLYQEFDCTLKDTLIVMIEAEHERAVYSQTVIVHLVDHIYIVPGFVEGLSDIGEIVG